ncbi:hypothetical protein RW1_024_00370 [Rhodococcus wratislaviensis NBRC 100605]|uniref:SLC41A/MgtE integral membrane domain-containing protein n=1 Tax=Rhodococcus wratislaviensis NBRC 100605 TaxID=1219028 RepID=X0PRX9_RHOWR|nr:hypothetical protein RW1_024_00370 [Rhodococcus wratislaviensis NBRC 100605]
MVLAVFMAAFEVTLEANVAVAYFIPGIVYLADAVGTQTETLAIRGLSVGVGIRRIVRREALTGLSVGALLGAVMLPVVSLMTGDTMLAVAVAMAVLAASAIATIVAMMLPWFLQRLGKDPAFGSGPLCNRSGPAVNHDLFRGRHCACQLDPSSRIGGGEAEHRSAYPARALKRS